MIFTYRSTIVIAGLILAACGGSDSDSVAPVGGGGSPEGSWVATPQAGTGGALSPATPQSVPNGDTTSFTVTTSPGYRLQDISGCGGTLNNTTFTTSAFDQDCIVTASFAVLDAPQNVVAVAGDAGVTLTWDTVPDAQGYNLYYASETITDIGNYATLAGGVLELDVTSPHPLTGLANGTTYYFRVTATASPGESLASSEASATPQELAVGATRPLNDTGLTTCGDDAAGLSDAHQNTLDCAAVGATTTSSGVDGEGDPVPLGQDALFGRDVTNNDPDDGDAGFSFTRLDGTGAPLAEGAGEAVCVQDNVTGLVWELKTNDGTTLRDSDNTYSWYNSTGINTGGDPGVQNAGDCVGGTGCDTEQYAADINALALCGFSDWRLPTPAELRSITHHGRRNPAIDLDFFPNTASAPYWTAYTTADREEYAISQDFGFGIIWRDSKANQERHVRLVRGGQ